MKKEMKPEDIRLAGWALIWSAVAFALGMLSQLVGGSAFWTIGTALVVLLSLPLLVFGLLGLRNRYGDNVGWFGKNILMTGAILGPLTTLMGIFAGLAHLLSEDSGWKVLYVGLAVSLACLTLFGIEALYKKPFPRWNVVPFIAGVWFPMLSLGAWGGNLDIPASVFAVLLTIQSIALTALGYLLKSDVPEATVSPA